MKSIAIMQPTFLPWIGYFALIDRVDSFVFFDHVQFEKRSWQQRNNIKSVNGALMLSVPVVSKGKQWQLIHETEILYEGNKSPFDKIIKSIEMAYMKAPYFSDFSNDIFAFMEKRPKYISDFNKEIITHICNILNITTPLLSSSDKAAQGHKDILLANICEQEHASHYISPPGSKVYLDKSTVFEERNIELSYHDYDHPTYSQLHGDFIPYMCILDLLFNEGEKSLDIIHKGMSSSL